MPRGASAPELVAIEVDGDRRLLPLELVNGADAEVGEQGPVWP